MVSNLSATSADRLAVVARLASTHPTSALRLPVSSLQNRTENC